MLPAHLTVEWEAFWELGTDRAPGPNGSGPIPFTAIDRWADRHGIDDAEEFDRFVALIRALDRVLLDHWAERRKAAEDARR